MDELVHSGCALPLHSVRHVRVDLQCEGRRRVSEVVLNRLRIVSIREGNHSVSMPQIVEPHLRIPDLFDDALEAVVNRTIRNIFAQPDSLRSANPSTIRTKQAF